MVREFECSSIFLYSWDQIVRAFWKRYPNPESTHVLSEDTICREVRDGNLYTKRILTKTNRPPKWGEGFVKSTIVTIVEESYVDPIEKRITTLTRNIGFTKLMSITEQVDYLPSTTNPTNETVVNRKAWIDSQIYGFRRAIESFGVERFKKNCIKAMNGFNYVLDNLYPPQQQQLAMISSIDNNSSSTNAAGSVSRFEETTGKFKKQAKRAGEIAKEKAGSLSSIYSASCQESTTNTPKMDHHQTGTS